MRGQGLGLLLIRVEKHRALLKIIREALPQALGMRCMDCLAKEDGRLIIFTDSQAFAAKLRFYAPLMAEKLSLNGFEFKDISLRILKRQQGDFASVVRHEPYHPPQSRDIDEALERLDKTLRLRFR